MLVGTEFLVSLSFLSISFAALVNRTIDSSNGDPVTGFKPIYQAIQHAWDDQTCGGCYIQPEPALAFDGTWTAATYHPSLQNVNITLEFTGVAIWVFFILANKNNHGPGTTTNTQCNFTLDEQYAGFFSHDPDMSTYDQKYNVTVFSQTGLSNTSHQLIIAANDYPISTFINFDYAIYMVELPDSPIDSPNQPSATETIPSSTTSTSSSSTLTSSTSSITSQSSMNLTSFTSEASSTTLPSESSSSSVSVLSKASPARTGLIIGSVISGLALTAVLLLACYRLRSRQMTIRAQRQMDDLRPSESATLTGCVADAPEHEIARLRDQVQEPRNVRRQQHSDWALGLADEEPPPSYYSHFHSPTVQL